MTFVRRLKKWYMQQKGTDRLNRITEMSLIEDVSFKYFKLMIETCEAREDEIGGMAKRMGK